MKNLLKFFFNKKKEFDMSKFLVVGLGNPESSYSGTRHNVGFDIINYLCESKNVVLSENRYGFTGKFKYAGKSIHILKPNTYMNLSGNPIKYWLNKLKIESSNLIVIVDDLNLDFGKSRIRPSGKDGGHNGLKSIIEKINTDNFIRLRFGIGNDFKAGKQTDYVLGKWSTVEENQLENLVTRNTEMILHIIKHGAENTMNKYN